MQAWTSRSCVPLQIRLRMITWDFLVSLFQQTSGFFFLRLLRFLSLMLPTAAYEAFGPLILRLSSKLSRNAAAKIGNTCTTWSTFHDSYVWWRSFCCFLVPLSIRWNPEEIIWKSWQVTNPPIDPIREAVVMSLGGGDESGWTTERVTQEMHPLGLKRKKPIDLLLPQNGFHEKRGEEEYIEANLIHWRLRLWIRSLNNLTCEKWWGDDPFLWLLVCREGNSTSRGEITPVSH